MEARQVLGETYAWFTEGFDTAGLKDAALLLNELAAPLIKLNDFQLWCLAERLLLRPRESSSSDLTVGYAPALCRPLRY